MFGSELCFVGFDENESYGVEIWKMEEGSFTVSRVTDINPGVEDSDPDFLTVIQNKLYFTAWDGSDYGVYTYDGSTVSLIQTFEKPVYFTEVNGAVLFIDNIFFGTRTLYRYDLTTEAVAQVLPSTTYPNVECYAAQPYAWNGRLYFAAKDNTAGGNGIYSTAGEADADVDRLLDLGTSADPALHFIEFDDELYIFITDTDGSGNCDLWATDGTSFRQVKQISGEGGSVVNQMFVKNGNLYFSLNNTPSLDDARLWRSDGTTAGTFPVAFSDPADACNIRSSTLAGDYILIDESNADDIYSWPAAPMKAMPRNKWVMAGVPVGICSGQECPGDLFQDDFGGAAPNGSNWMLSRWDPATNMYMRYYQNEADGNQHGDPADIAPGLGYWLIQDVADDACAKVEDLQSDGACCETDPHVVTMNLAGESDSYRGLVMLANPYPYTYDVSKSLISLDSGTGYTVSTAASEPRNWISGNIYTWDYTSGAGEYITTPINEASLEPWEGFWAEALVAVDPADPHTLDFSFIPPGYTMPLKNGVQEAPGLDDADGWTLDLPVRSVDGAYLDESNRLGVGRGYRDGFDPWDGTEFSPMSSRFVQLYFDHPEWDRLAENYTFDLRSDNFRYGDKVWDFTVRTWNLANRTFEISWPGIQSIPEEYQFSLEELDSDGAAVMKVDMRKVDKARVTTGPHTGDYEQHHYRIRVAKKRDPLGLDDPVITPLPASYAFRPSFPNPFNPVSSITVALPRPSNLKVEVFNIEGRHVATLASGRYEAGYQRFTFDGSALASGTYLVRATVPGKLEKTQKLQLVK